MKPNNTFCYGITKNIYNDILKDNYDAIWIYGNAGDEDKVKLVRQQLYLWMVPDDFIHVYLNAFFDKGWQQLFTGIRSWCHKKVLVINVNSLFLKNVNFIYSILDFIETKVQNADLVNFSSYIEEDKNYICFNITDENIIDIENILVYSITDNVINKFLSADKVNNTDIRYIKLQYPLAIKNEYDTFSDNWSLWNTGADPLKYNFLY